MATATRHPFRVRKQTSGYNGITKYIVVMLRNGRAERVSVHAHITRESAQMAADDLNISDMVKDYDQDPRPYAERLAEARAAYLAEQQG